MTLVKWMNRPAMNPWFDPFFVSERSSASCGCKPAANILETGDSFVIEMAVPGRNKEDFSLNLEKDILTISSEKESPADENMNYTRREFQTTAFSRSYIVPKTVDSERIEAAYEQGILRVTLPKKEEAKATLSKQISIN